MHLDQRCQAGRVAEIEGVFALGQRGTVGRFHRDGPEVLAAAQFFADEGKSQPAEIAAATGAAYNDIRVVSGHLHLLDGLLADNGLVQ